MWLLGIVYLSICVKICACQQNIKNEISELSNILLESLKADPILLDDNNVSEKSRQFIDGQIEKFVSLVIQSKNAVFSRTKRSLEDKENHTKSYSINISPEKLIPTEYPDDIKIFKQGSRLFAVSLQDKNELGIYEYLNDSFSKILKEPILYDTNVGIWTVDNLEGFVVGENQKIKIFLFDTSRNEVRVVQTLNVRYTNHIVLWEQDNVGYLSIVNYLNIKSKNEDRRSKIKIYKWLGKHFDLVQDIELFNIKKSVPFFIHGSYFLAAVKYKPTEDEIKSYSDIFKFNLNSMKFEPYQRLLTDKCTDIKYFKSSVHEETHHFLVVVHSVDEESTDINSKSNSKSIIYKYVEQYFIPFQSIQTNALEWQPIQDSKGHSALIAVTKSGLKGFQYDGWHFSETYVASSETFLTAENIKAIHTFQFINEDVLVVACDHCNNSTNIFKVNFTQINVMKEIHSQVLSWCQNSLHDIESRKEPSIVAESLRGDLNEEIALEEDQQHQLSAALKQSNHILYNLEDLAANSLQFDNDHIITNDIEAEKIVFKNDATLKLLKTQSLNNVDNVNSLLDNVLNVNDGFNIDDTLSFNVIFSEEEIFPKIINNINSENFVRIDSDMTLKQLIVKGNVTFENDVTVKDFINNFRFSDKTMLLNDIDQEFNELNIDVVKIGNLTTKYLNLVDLESLNDLIDKRSEKISYLDSFKAKNVDIVGLLNEISVPSLETYALKKSGDQILEEIFFFDNLTVTNLYVEETVSMKKIPEDFVLIDGGEITINHDVYFKTGLKVEKLEILHSLNNISVTDDGGLDILFTDDPRPQTITKKTFDNLAIANPIKLRNKIKNDQMNRVSPLIVNENAYVIDSDVTIEGKVEARRWLRAEDIEVQEEGRTIKVLLSEGIKLTDSEIPVHLNFTFPLDLEDTIADRVNDLDPHDWLLENSESTQTVRGHKHFLRDLNFEGHLSAFRVNDVDVSGLISDALRVEGDQEIGGNFEVDILTAEAGVLSKDTHFGEEPIETLFFSKPNSQETADILIIYGNLNANSTIAHTLEVQGLTNLQNFTDILKDLVTKDTKFKIFGQKRFTEFHVADELIVPEKSEFIKLLNSVNTNEITLEENLDRFNEIEVHNLRFQGTCNKLTEEQFKEMVKFENNNEETIVKAFGEFEEIVVLGDVYVKDNFINKVNLTKIENGTVKIDEDFQFETVKFNEAILVEKTLNLEGYMENLDLDNIFEQNSGSTIKSTGKIFNKNVNVEGTLNIEATLNGTDIREICKFSDSRNNLKTLKIEGDVTFVKGPKILQLNELNVNSLNKNLWFSDRPANITGAVRLQNITFQNIANVEGYVDEINLKLLSQNYFSKSKDQTILSTLSFQDHVSFVNVSTPKLKTQGPINGIVVESLLKTVLLQNTPQIFEEPVYFEEVKVKELSEGNAYLVNDFNLETDVMQYDKVNLVTGHKVIKNVNIGTLKLKNNVNIQDVDVLDWLTNVVLTNGSFSITGKTFLKNGSFKQGLSLRGNLNGKRFNEKNIMLVDFPQNISGKKMFVTENGEERTKFKYLKMNGLINDINVTDLVENQSNKNKNIIFHSELVFNKNVFTKNINVETMYDNINVTQLLTNVSELGSLENFEQNYKNLLDMSVEIENSVKDQASFFKYYKEMMPLENTYDVFGLNCADQKFRLVTFSFKNGSNMYSTFELDYYNTGFLYIGENIESYSIPSYMEHLSLGDKDYLYIEHVVKRQGIHGNNGLLYLGKLLHLTNSTTFEHVAEFERNSTLSLISFTLPGLNQPCLGFIDQDMAGIDILCDENSQNYYRFQKLELHGVYKATTVRTFDTLYLLAATRGSQLHEPSIKVFIMYTGKTEFEEIQTIFEGADPCDLTAAAIDGVAYAALAYGPQESTVNLGRISIRRFDRSYNQFTPWQHIPLPAPLGAHLITEVPFEPLLIAPSVDASAPLSAFRYDGIAGFKRVLQGTVLPSGSRIRSILGGRFLVALQGERGTAVVLRGVFKGLVRN